MALTAHMITIAKTLKVKPEDIHDGLVPLYLRAIAKKMGASTSGIEDDSIASYLKIISNRIETGSMTGGEAVEINTDATTSFELENNTEYRRSEIASLVLTLPESMPEEFVCQVCFTSGDAATEVTMPDGVKLVGDAVKNGAFVPTSGYRYCLMFWFDGVVTWCAVCAAALSEDSNNNSGNDYGVGVVPAVYCATDYGISTDSDNNTVALQTLIDNVSAAGGGIIFFPIGTYNFQRWGSPDSRWAIEMKSNVSIFGENIEKTVLKLTQKFPYALFGRILANGAGATDPLTGCTFSNFTVDAYETGDVNNVAAKAFFFQYVRDCVFRDLRLMGTIATAMGIDFIDRVVIDNVSCIDCGRTYTGSEPGTSGIGIGTAGWENENFIITNCVCDGCGQYGIFIENQGIFYEGNVPYAKGCIISNCIVRNGINKGIGIRGGQNVTVIGCESYENASHGIYIDNNCKNVKVISCSASSNGGAGILVEPNSTEHLLVKECTFVNNQAEGIGVNVAAGKNASKLCIQDCYTDGNAIGLELSASSLRDFVLLGNATLDGIHNNTEFVGSTSFNDIVNGVVEVEPVITEIAVPFASMANGMKLMPDGSLVEGTLNATFVTEYYIDVSGLKDTFEVAYPGGGGGGAIRIAQYDEAKNSLSDSFGLVGKTSTKGDYGVWEVVKLEGCRYIRLFLSGVGCIDGIVRNVTEA
jgi:hypothetical protein